MILKSNRNNFINIDVVSNRDRNIGLSFSNLSWQSEKISAKESCLCGIIDVRITSFEIFSKTKELRYVTECIKRDLKVTGEIKFKYIGNKISTKYSVGDKIRKKYNFHYFQIVDIGDFFNDKRTFRCNGKKYCWKTLDEMYSDKNIKKKNMDVLDYVRQMCDIS